MKELTNEAYTDRALRFLDRAVRYGFVIDESYREREFDEVVGLAETVLVNKDPDTMRSLKATEVEKGKWLFKYDGEEIVTTMVETGEDGKKYACAYYVDDKATVVRLVSEKPIE